MHLCIVFPSLPSQKPQSCCHTDDPQVLESCAGIEWDALAQLEEARIRKEKLKLRTLGGLPATPLLPSLCHQSFQIRQKLCRAPICEHIKPRAQGKQRPTWLLEQH
jgi:hypothetical protein